MFLQVCYFFLQIVCHYFSMSLGFLFLRTRLLFVFFGVTGVLYVHCMVFDLGEGTCECDLSLVKHEDLVAVSHHTESMGHKNHCLALVFEFAHYHVLKDTASHLRVEGTQSVVHQVDVSVCIECSC